MNTEPFTLRTIALTVLAIYLLVMAVFLISENRRPQATLSWLLVLYAAPGIGLLVYFFFGRDSKAFSRRQTLLMQDLAPNARPLLSPLPARQDAEITRLEQEDPVSRKLMMLVRRNSRSALTRRNHVEILQNATGFYPRLIDDMEAAQHSIHHQYFIWRSDEFTERLKELMIRKARQGVEVRILYDAVGSQSLRRGYIRELKAAGSAIAPTSPRYHLHTLSYRNHRKISVIDGTIGYTGGMNIGQEHVDGGDDFDLWRDTQLRVVGESVAVLQTVFMVDWYNAVREDLFAAPYFPPAAIESAEGDIPVQILTSGPDSRWSAISQLYSAKRARTSSWPKTTVTARQENSGDVTKTIGHATASASATLSMASNDGRTAENTAAANKSATTNFEHMALRSRNRFSPRNPVGRAKTFRDLPGRTFRAVRSQTGGEEHICRKTPCLGDPSMEEPDLHRVVKKCQSPVVPTILKKKPFGENVERLSRCHRKI